jgi:hypothetical protein
MGAMTIKDKPKVVEIKAINPSYSSPLIAVHCCSLLFFAVHCCSSLVIAVHCCSSLFFTVHRHSSQCSGWFRQMPNSFHPQVGNSGHHHAGN